MEFEHRKLSVDEKILNIQGSLKALNDSSKISFIARSDTESDRSSSEIDKSNFVVFGSDTDEDKKDWQDSLLALERELVKDLTGQLAQREKEISDLTSFQKNLIEDLKHTKHLLEQKSSELSALQHQTAYLRPEKSLLNELEETFHNLEHDQENNVLLNAYNALIEKHDKLHTKYRKKLNLNKKLKEELIAVKSDVDKLAKELKRRPPRKVLEDTKSKIKELENIIDKPQREPKKLVKSLLAILKVHSQEEISTAVQKLVKENKNYIVYKSFVLQLTKLIEKVAKNVSSPSPKLLFKWIERLIHEYLSLKRQEKQFKVVKKMLSK